MQKTPSLGVFASQQPVEMPDILPDVDAFELASQQLCELHHAPPVQAFAVRLFLRKCFLLNLATFIARAELESVGKRLDFTLSRHNS
ncbi:hypothetical protein TNCV_2082901 [Trichonephila clavipes]|nr:hypothetical protein TNCV_2082901 [Trichonephila clavipes]